MANRTGLVIDQRNGAVLVAPDLDLEGKDLVIGEDGGGIVLGGVRVVANEELLEAIPVKVNELGDAKARRDGDVAIYDFRIGVAVLVTVLDAFIEVEPVGNLLWRARVRCRGDAAGVAGTGSSPPWARRKNTPPTTSMASTTTTATMAEGLGPLRGACCRPGSCV